METQTHDTRSNLWWLLLLQGISAIILGFLLLTYPAATADTIILFVGVYWLVSGVFSIVRIFSAAGRAHWVWSLLIGLLGILAGIFVLGHPVISAILLPETLVIVIAIQGILIGILDIVRGSRGDGWGAFVIGVLSILIGVWLLFNPLAAALSLPLVLGIFGLVGGVLLMVHAFQVRKQLR
jgi:uncharacterized membrane protein HdeD (DUF308 family)